MIKINFNEEEYNESIQKIEEWDYYIELYNSEKKQDKKEQLKNKLHDLEEEISILFAGVIMHERNRQS